MSHPSDQTGLRQGSPTLQATDDSIVHQLLSRWEEAASRGEFLTAEALCADTPGLLDQVRWKLSVLQESSPQHGQPTIIPEAGINTAHGPGEATAPEGLDIAARYRELRFLAKGGLGAVYVAEDGALHREVAVKFVHPQLTRDPLCLQRFQVEAEITARLEHPGVVPLHAFGRTSDGRPFYVMRLIRGETLDDAISRFHANPATHQRTAAQSIEFRDLLGRFVTACQTLAYAHNRGVLHRDLKPQNIMLGRYGETLVVDWGLAMPIGRNDRARASGEHTLIPTGGSSNSDSSGGGAGTPAFMSPEQAAGTIELTPASDIFSLGATLYKILTGRTPYDGRTIREVVEQARSGQFPAPRSINRHIPAAIEAVCLKAMALRPDDRYATALDLARDVERFLADEPTSISSEAWHHRLGRWSRHHRGAARLLAISGLLAVLGACGAAVAFHQLADHERLARVNAETAREQGLRVASRFAARTVAGEIDLRWRILETEAADPEMRSALATLNTNPEDEPARKQLQAWLDSRFIEHNQTTRATSWFLMDKSGLQHARTPATDTIGGRFAFRDYFHGQGRDLTVDEATTAAPIRNVYRSAVYTSRSSGTMKVAFSAPVWSGKVGTPNREVLGVLAMAVDLGEFSVLQSGLGSDQMAVLVDTRADRVSETGSTNQGLILHHPLMKQSTGDEAEDIEYRVDEQALPRLLAMRSARLHNDSPTSQTDNLITDYRDPLAPENEGTWLAAFEPVLVRGRATEQRDTGWIVIVQMRGNQAD